MQVYWMLYWSNYLCISYHSNSKEKHHSWLWFTRRQVSELIIRFPQLKPLAGLERPFVKSQLLSTVNVSDPSIFRRSGNPKTFQRST